MIAQLRGKLIYKTATDVVIECGGVGFAAMVSVNTSDLLGEINNEVLIYTVLIPREDALSLYGFSTESERDAFKLLISISGIGPKIALGILSSLTVESFQEYVLSNNLLALQKLPGIGKKTAERLILELREKVTKIKLQEPSSSVGLSQLLIKQEASAALITLGYSSALADKVIKSALTEFENQEITAEKLIKKALSYALR
mgnify:FL=1